MLCTACNVLCFFLGERVLGSGDDRQEKLEEFRQKDICLLKNNKYQCFETSVLAMLLPNEDFRNAVVDKMKSGKPLLEQYVVNAHLTDNLEDDWLYKLACSLESGNSFANKAVQHDAQEFLAQLLDQLALPNHLFQSKRRVEIKCQGLKCAQTPIPTYSEDEMIPGIVYCV